MPVLSYLSPDAARQQQADGALMVDIRQQDEFLREHIPHARLYPLADRPVAEASRPFTDGQPVIFYCLSGQRCKQYAEQLNALAPPGGAFLLEGGINAWKRAGLPVQHDASQPLPIMRQVQIAAGSLILLGTGLGFALHPGFFVLVGLVGAGLVMAGISGFCGMARLLMRMPWNKPQRAH